MRPKTIDFVELHRVTTGQFGTDPSYGNNGVFVFTFNGMARLRVIASDGGGWDHVSVSTEDRCPTWDEMHWIKRQFWDDSETVMQLHPKATEYVNHHPYCLHLWKKQGQEIELPPSEFVGPKGAPV